MKRIPDFLRTAYDQGLAGTGAVIVTDDPKTFFVLRAKLAEGRFSFSQRVYAAESEEVVFAAIPLPADWKPALKSNSNFSVGIVDLQASSVAANGAINEPPTLLRCNGCQVYYAVFCR